MFVGHVTKVMLALIAMHVLPILGMAGASADSVTQKPVIHLACTSFPPMKIDNSADGRGIDVDIIDEALQRAGLTLRTTFLPWKRGYVETLNGSYDGLCGCSKSPERESLFHFSAPVRYNRLGYFIRKDSSFHFDPINPDPSLFYGVVRGYVQEVALRDKGITFETASNNQQLARMLAGGRFDVVMGFEAPISWQANRLDPPEEFEFFEQGSTSSQICFSRKSTHLVPYFAAIDKALEEMEQEGRKAAIAGKYK